MMQGESVQLLRQILSDISGNLELSLSVLRDLEDSMRETSASTSPAEFASLNSRLEEIENRLSTLEAGLRKLIENRDIMNPHDAWKFDLHHFLSSRTRESRSGKPS